jgi:hypothetical protein
MKKINEGKQVGPIYHVMDVDKFYSMLQSDFLRKPTSFSRNKDYDHVYGREKEYVYQIKVNGDKLSNKYKIFPTYDGHGWVYDEYEEKVNRDILDVGKYIEEIIVIRKKKYQWKERGYNKWTYNKWTGSKELDEISKHLSEYMRKYPHIKLKVKEGHGGTIKEIHGGLEKWLRSMGILNPKEALVKKELEGAYKNRERIYSDISHEALYKAVIDNKSEFFVPEIDRFGEIIEGSFIPVSELDPSQPYWDDFLRGRVMGAIEFLVDTPNNYVVLEVIKDSKNKIIVHILHNKETKKEIGFYEGLCKKIGVSYKSIDLPQSYMDYYESLENQAESLDEKKKLKMKKINTFKQFTQSLLESNRSELNPFMDRVLQILSDAGSPRELEDFYLNDRDLFILSEEMNMNIVDIIKKIDRFFLDRNNMNISQDFTIGGFDISNIEPIRWTRSSTRRSSINWETDY